MAENPGPGTYDGDKKNVTAGASSGQFAANATQATTFRQGLNTISSGGGGGNSFFH